MLISIVIPTFNESAYIVDCLNSVLSFEKPADVSVEILIVDGRSTDNTRNLVSEIARQHSEIQLLDNPGRFQASALNIAIRQARGQWLLRLDAHAFYPRNYLSLCIETAQRSNADNVGGVVVTLPRTTHYQSFLVQALTTHRFGVGDSGFRLGRSEGKADTVPYGFYQRSVFDRIGLFDERLVRNEDYEFNRRLIVFGGKIWLNPAIQVFYYNQKTLGAFLRKQFYLEAPYNAYLWYLAPYAFTFRHSITGLFAFGVVAGILLTIVLYVLSSIFDSSVLSEMAKWVGVTFGSVILLYLFLAIISSVQQATRFRQPKHVLCLPFAFFLYHFVHGLGILYGLCNLIMCKAPVQQQTEPWQGANRFRAWPITTSTSSSISSHE